MTRNDYVATTLPSHGGTATQGSGRLLLLRLGLAGHQGRRHLVGDDLAVDDDLADIASRRDVVHDVEEHFLDDGPQPARTGAALERLVGDRPDRVLGELELDAVELEELLVL